MPSVDLRAAAVGDSGGRVLVVRRSGNSVVIEELEPSGRLRTLGVAAIPPAGRYLIVRQLVCAQGSGLEHRVVLFGRVAPLVALGTIQVLGFTGPVSTSSEGDYLFVSVERAQPQLRWTVTVGGFLPVSSTVAMAGQRLDNTVPASEPCAAFDPASIPEG